jgi:hypothetical protein
MIHEKERPRAYDWEPSEHINPNDWYAPLPREEHLFLRGVIAGVIAEAVAVIVCAGIIWAVWG